MAIEDITTVTVTVHPEASEHGRLLAPVGIPTPYQTPLSFSVSGGSWSLTGETTTGQMAALIETEDHGPVMLTYRFSEIAGHYPDALFRPRETRFTRAAADLVRDARRIAEDARDGHSAIAAIVNDTAEKFTYGHPATKYYDGLDAIRVLARRAAELLRPGGVLGVEHADVQGESVPSVLAATGRWTDVRDHVDLAGRARFATARLAR